MSSVQITPSHLARKAAIYIRQSSLMQVTRHAESTQLQYSLVERAIKLGWPRERVEVIDEDLGNSGVDASARGGFQYLLAEISLARAGLVLSFDASRLARPKTDMRRTISNTVVTTFGRDLATANTEFERVESGRRGRQSQTWARIPEGWRVVSAHVSFMPTT